MKRFRSIDCLSAETCPDRTSPSRRTHALPTSYQNGHPAPAHRTRTARRAEIAFPKEYDLPTLYKAGNWPSSRSMRVHPAARSADENDPDRRVASAASGHCGRRPAAHAATRARSMGFAAVTYGVAPVRLAFGGAGATGTRPGDPPLRLPRQPCFREHADVATRVGQRRLRQTSVGFGDHACADRRVGGLVDEECRR